MYAISGGRALAEALEGVADLVPLPFLSAFVKIAIKVLEACEEATAIEENLLDLQGRVYDLMLAVVDTVPVNKKTSLELQDKVRKLQAILDTILADVQKIKDQKKWLLLIFRNLNKERVDRCVARLNAALQQFNVVSQLHVEDVLDKIRADYSAFAAQLNRIEDAVNRTTGPHNAPSAYPRQDMPPRTRKLYGREALVEEIANLLASEGSSRVCITGAGGMGKTSVALAVVDSPTIKTVFPKEFIFWVPCVEAKSSDLLRRILYAQLRVTAETYDSLDTLILELDATKQRRLILLDNFETPWLSGEDQAKVGHILVRLAELSHIAILVTMTSGFTPGDIEWQHRPLAPLDSAPARDAFKSKYKDAAGGHELTEDARELDRFLTSIGRIPLAITLAAATGGRLRTSVNDLSKAWGKGGTAMLTGPPTHSMDETIRVSMEQGVVKSSPEALKLLAILSLLPAGTTGINLDWWAATLITPQAAVDMLRAAALIEQSDGPFGASRIFVHPTIQSYMSRNGHISTEVQELVHDACYKFVLDHKSIPDDRKFKADLEALASEQINIQGLLMENDVHALRPNAIDALIAFASYQVWTKPSTKVASYALKVAQAARDDPDVSDLDAAARRVAQAHRCLGKVFFTLDRYAKAYKHFEAASDGFKNLPGGADLPRCGESSMEALRTWRFMKTNCTGEHEARVKEAQAQLASDEAQRYDLANGLLGLGQFLWWQRRRDQAIETLAAAKAEFDSLKCSASSAECLYYMARAYARLDEPSKALVVAQEALAMAEDSGEIGLICRTSGVAAIYLMVSGLYEEALAVITRSLTSYQSVGAPIGIAQSLELLAYNCAARSDLSGARVAYDGARIQFAKRGSGRLGRLGVTRCTENLQRFDGLIAIGPDFFGDVVKPVPWY
ncbi:hypothetical protein R3P38DRAFT_1116689 [Favolaschia claudopus]|uniref:NB-ARC domain-containing protein n=1 Tax=Favolaschia claudopus TaxID=2862362 RepID=A0AAW0B8F1_9AGAR